MLSRAGPMPRSKSRDCWRKCGMGIGKKLVTALAGKQSQRKQNILVQLTSDYSILSAEGNTKMLLPVHCRTSRWHMITTQTEQMTSHCRGAVSPNVLSHVEWLRSKVRLITFLKLTKPNGRNWKQNQQAEKSTATGIHLKSIRMGRL